MHSPTSSKDPPHTFLRWAWAYDLETLATAVNAWCRAGCHDPTQTFLWICCFCNSQFRILVDKKACAADDLEGLFEEWLMHIGRVLVLLNDFRTPLYTTRCWCVFETYVATENNVPIEVLLPQQAQSEFQFLLEDKGVPPSRHT